MRIQFLEPIRQMVIEKTVTGFAYFGLFGHFRKDPPANKLIQFSRFFVFLIFFRSTKGEQNIFP